MAGTWKVKDGTQVKFDGKLYTAGKTFSATQEQIDGLGLAGLVDKTQPKRKAQASSPNKAQTSAPNKAQSSPPTTSTWTSSSVPVEGKGK